MATAYLSLEIAVYIIVRCTLHEWEVTYPCNSDTQELENTWNLKNCLWLALGTVLQQGCDILPKACSTRVTTAVWCFFTLIITSTYTANLAAFLTTQRMESPIKNVEDLANQDRVKYGCLRKGATADFFRYVIKKRSNRLQMTVSTNACGLRWNHQILQCSVNLIKRVLKECSDQGISMLSSWNPHLLNMNKNSIAT